MKFKRIITLICFFSFTVIIVAQHNIIIKAIILDKETNEPIPYANIGFVGESIGTISDLEGKFILEFDRILIRKEPLIISVLGYKTLKIQISNLQQLLSKNHTIYLNTQPFELDEVVLTNEKRIQKIIGVNSSNKTVIGYWKDKDALGGEIATLINIKKQNTKLLELKLHVVENLSDSLRVRVNVYNYKNGYPKENLLKTNIFYTITKNRGEIDIDLRPYNIMVSNDIVIGIELIEVYGNKIGFVVSANDYLGPSYTKYISQDFWKENRDIGMNFAVLISVPKRKKNTDDNIAFNDNADDNSDKVNKSNRSSTFNKEKKNYSFKRITGKITSLNAGLEDVNIINKNQNTGTKTNSEGNYVINAKTGDVLQLSYVGFKTVSIVVEDITSVLNIEMITQINELEEAVVIVDRKPGIELERALNAEEKFTSSRGIFDPRSSGFAVGYINGEDISPVYPSLIEALDGKLAGVKKDIITGELEVRGNLAIWDIDGQVFGSPPTNVNLSQIKDIHILKAGNIRYGSNSPVIIVRTNYGTYDNEEVKKKDIALQYINKNYYKGDASTNYSNYSQENSAILKEIIGKVTSLNSALPDVNILNKNQSRGAKTNAQGNYVIQARTGDKLQFSYVGFKTVRITVEDITNVLNIEMVIEITELEEAIVKTDTKGREYRRAKRAEKKFNSSMGTFDPKTAGYAVALIDGVEINIGNGTLTQALVGKFAGYRVKDGVPFLRGDNMSITQSYPAIWDIDGAVYTEEPPIDISIIKDIHVMKSLAAVNRYGNIANGGVIIVRTVKSSFEDDDRKDLADKYTNKDYYNDDAVVINKESFITNQYTKTLTDLKIKQKAFDYYNDSLKTTIKDYNTHIGIAQDFNNYYKDRNLSSQILKDLAKKHYRNAEILKAIAFQMQEYDLKKDAIEIYKYIFKLRPKYAQSYRDLANAYLEDNQFKRSWKLYMSYLLKGNDVSGEGIGQILYNEMEWLYFNRNNQSSINVQFVPKSENIIDFRNDIRLVFEWNTSEAEFDLEFVNPQKQVYTFEHSLYKNQELISDEKEKGYSSKEFIIDDVKQGQWLVNLTYKGNKKPEPTYLKVTKYYYWGKPNQHSKVMLYKLDKEHEKIQLYRLNKQSLLVTN